MGTIKANCCLLAKGLSPITDIGLPTFGLLDPLVQPTNYVPTLSTCINVTNLLRHKYDVKGGCVSKDIFNFVP